MLRRTERQIDTDEQTQTHIEGQRDRQNKLIEDTDGQIQRQTDKDGKRCTVRQTD